MVNEAVTKLVVTTYDKRISSSHISLGNQAKPNKTRMGVYNSTGCVQHFGRTMIL